MLKFKVIDEVLDSLETICSSREWKQVETFCAKEQELDVMSFRVLVNIYKRMTKEPQLPSAAACVENMIFQHNVIPKHVATAKDVREWNQALLKFFRLAKKITGDTDANANKLVCEWWKSVATKYWDKCNVFDVACKSTVLTAEKWKGIFPVTDVSDKVLLHCGEIETLVNTGKSYYVIHFLNKFDISAVSADVKKVICRWAAQIPAKDMLEYVQSVSASSNSTENFRIFTIHPMGLDLLMKSDCFGAIASMEKQFKAVINDYPREFERFAKRKSYIASLSCALDETI